MKQFFKTLTVAIATVATLNFVSCNKEDAPLLNSRSQNHNAKTLESLNIPYFADVEAMERAIETANSFSTTDSLALYETTHGIRSIGRLADEFYEANSPTEDNYVDGMMLWQSHPDLLDTVHFDAHEVCIEPKWFDSPYRYVANENGMYSVGETVFKLFKEGPVSTTIDNAEGLLALTEADLPTADTSIYHRPATSSSSVYEHPACAYKLEVENTPVTYNDRLFIKLKTTFPTHIGHDFSGGIYFFRKAKTQVKVYNRHKWAGIWWCSKHTYSCSGSVTIHRYTGDGTYASNTYTFSKTKKCITLTIDVNEEDVSDLGFSEMLFDAPKYYHYKSYYIQASFPGHDPEYLIH